MKIAVLNGSPKGVAVSTTMQYVHFIQKNFPNHQLKIINISQPIRKIEKNEPMFQKIIDDIKSSDAVLWAFPVYYMLVPGNYKRFIELIWERKVEDAFRDKPAAILATSIKYMDHSAYYYMQAICEDLGMKFMGQFTPAMYDLEKEKGRKKTITFASNFFEDLDRDIYTQKNYLPVAPRYFNYEPGTVNNKIDPNGKKILVITDHEENQENLKRMIKRFADCFTSDVEVINLRDIETKGSCLGCIKCWYDHTCVYNDQYIEFMHEKVLKSDLLIWAGAIKDRFLSSKWKIFLDRSFCNGHIPWLTGKQVSLIVSGPLSQVPNIREVFEVFIELMEANIGGFVTDEYGESSDIDRSLDSLAGNMVRDAEKNYVRPMTFLGYGSNLVLREMFWGRFRFPFVADWKLHFGKLDDFKFPHDYYKTRFKNNFMMQLSRFPKFRKYVSKNLKNELVKPLKEVVND